MLKHILAGTAAVAAMALVAPAMAGHQTGQLTNATYGVEVNINVAEEVTMWAGDDVIDLVLDGKGPENADVVESSISHQNNVAADITVSAEGTLPPDENGQAAVNFFIFDDTDDASALALIQGNANNPPGGLKWTADNLGTTHNVTNVGISNFISTRTVSYAASAPNFLPDMNDFHLEVIWTIAP